MELDLNNLTLQKEKVKSLKWYMNDEILEFKKTYNNSNKNDVKTMKVLIHRNTMK